MKFVDEFRDPVRARQLAERIENAVTRPWTIMEICGGQTHAIIRYGIDTVLPEPVTLVHGPGCPVCVTPIGIIDQALAIARLPSVIFCSFGDMMRVPGTERDLLSVRAEGGDVRMVYSPLDAVAIAEEHPDREVVFFAVGFETTAPANAMAVHQARERNVKNFSLLVSHVLVPPAMETILSAPDNRVQGFLAAGHVCTIMGTGEYVPIARKFGVPIVVTGFEPLDVLQGIYQCITQLEEGRAEVENAYPRSVRDSGNPRARELIQKVFAIRDRVWRGLGEIPFSGLELQPPYDAFDARQRFDVAPEAEPVDSPCISGQILKGVRKPPDCEVFGTDCTPEHPLGATMVSSEGACAAYYQYRTPEGRPQ